MSLWMSLLEGDVITIYDSKTKICSGYVDDRTKDGTVIWVIDDIGGRRLFHIGDGFNFEVSGNIYNRRS